MSGKKTQIPPKQLEKIEKKFKEGIMNIARIQNNKGVLCFRKNPTDMEGFINCFRGFYDKNIEIEGLVEQRMNWCLFQFGQCMESKLLSGLTSRWQT